MSCKTLLQFNDQSITVPVSNLDVPFDLATVTSAEYKLYDQSRSNVLFTLTLGSGITRSENEFTIILTDEQTKNLRGIYYHELTMVDPTNLRSSLFKDFIEFEATYN